MKRILVIDDSAVIRKAIRRILESQGFSVEEAADGALGLAVVAEKGPFDVVFCDIDMPNMDGLTFVSTLRATPGMSDTPIVMCSTHSSYERISDALGRGANEYIMKPFDGEIVDAKLAACGIS